MCGLAIAGRDKIRADTAVHRRRIKELENDVAALKKQLDEFISVKESDEAILLEKFRALLNEKKLKIREQQRLLASVAPDKSQLTSTSPPHSPGPSRPSKRKTRLDEEDEDDDSDARAPGDRGPKADEDSTEDRETPGRMSETEAEETADEAEETADEAEETADGAKGGEEGIRPATTRRAAAAPAAKTKKAPSKAGGRGKGRDRGKTAAAKAKASSQAKDDDVPPPRRELPFATRHAAAQRSSKAAERSESETASDEEL